MARTDTLSILIENHDRRIEAIASLISELDAILTAIELDPNYAELTAGEVIQVDANQAAIVAWNAAVAVITP